MNVTFFVHSLDSGGIENYLLRFLKEYHNNFKKIYVYCKSGKAGQLKKNYLQISNLEVIEMRVGFFDLVSCIRLRYFLNQNDIDTVCDFTGNFAGLIMWVAYSLDIRKRVVFYRNSTNRFSESILRNQYDALSKHLVKRYATNILCNSKAGLNFYFPKIWRENPKFKVIYNGVNARDFTCESTDLRKQLGIPEEAFVIGHTGRFNDAKNHHTILHVAAKLIKDNDDIYFIMCGNGVRKNLEPILIREKINNRVFVFENRTDIPKFLNTMDCYFFPSITEGQPNALIEAMICGIPFVASNIEPIKEVVGSCNNLYPPNDIDSFTNALLSLYHKRPPLNFLQQDYYKSKFDHSKNFNIFFKELV